MLKIIEIVNTLSGWTAVGTTMAALLTGGCNTIEGAGEDIEAAGEGTQDMADGDN